MRPDLAAAVLAVLLGATTAHAESLRDRLAASRAARLAEDAGRTEAVVAEALPAGSRVERDVPYGDAPRQRLDVYLPPQARNAPAIFMVHGGAWRVGDKRARSVVENKAARWLAKGFVFVSANYRMLPDAAPLEQAQDVARALAAAQRTAATLGADPDRFILMGHSAGAHLVALIDASPALAAQAGARPWLGAVVLDSAALDVPAIMANRHAPLYDRAFGDDPRYWQAASPLAVLASGAPPVLAVCSSLRSDSCAAAQRFAAAAAARKVRAAVLPQRLTHMHINQDLGLAGAYTDAVEAFMATLDAGVGRLLTGG